jgi:hypothetical protein
MPVWWTFRCYLDAVGVDVIGEWYEGQPDQLQAKFDTRIRYLRQQSRDKWIRPHFDTLGEDCAGLGELRFEWKNTQYRIIGFASGKMEYSWLMPAIERGGKFEPRETCAIAQRRKAEILADRRRARDCDFE